MLDSAAVKKAALIGHSWGSLIALKPAANLVNRISHLVEKAKSAGKTFKVVSLAVGHHQMTEAPEETLFEISGFLK